jgi:hypothetical protein
MPSPERTEYAERVLSASFTPAPVRMVVVEAKPGEDDDTEDWREMYVEHRFYPVLGIAVEIFELYRRGPAGPLKPAAVLPLTMSPAEIRKGGWALFDAGARYLPCWINWTGALRTSLEHERYLEDDWEHLHFEVFAAPWPPEEDEDRLAEAIGELEHQVRQSVFHQMRAQQRGEEGTVRG